MGPLQKAIPIWLWVKTNGTILGVNSPPILEPILVGLVDVHCGYGLLTHGHLAQNGPGPLSTKEIERQRWLKDMAAKDINSHGHTDQALSTSGSLRSIAA